jgi:hypothetical protein
MYHTLTVCDVLQLARSDRFDKLQEAFAPAFDTVYYGNDYQTVEAAVEKLRKAKRHTLAHDLESAIFGVVGDALTLAFTCGLLAASQPFITIQKDEAHNDDPITAMLADDEANHDSKP